MNCRILKAREGDAPIGHMVFFIVFILVAAIGIILFNINESSSKDAIQNDISQQKEFEDGHSNLISFLKQPNNRLTNSDIILNSYYSDNFAGLEPLISDFFNSKYSNDWVLVVEEPNGDIFFSANPNSLLVRAMISISTTRQEVAAAYLPLNPSIGQDYLKIRLFLTKLVATTPYT